MKARTTDPAMAMAAQILRQAQVDAERGDLAALAWLVLTGCEIADILADGGRVMVLRWARRCLERHDHGEVARRWGVEA